MEVKMRVDSGDNDAPSVEPFGVCASVSGAEQLALNIPIIVRRIIQHMRLDDVHNLRLVSSLWRYETYRAFITGDSKLLTFLKACKYGYIEYLKSEQWPSHWLTAGFRELCYSNNIDGINHFINIVCRLPLSQRSFAIKWPKYATVLNVESFEKIGGKLIMMMPLQANIIDNISIRRCYANTSYDHLTGLKYISKAITYDNPYLLDCNLNSIPDCTMATLAASISKNLPILSDCYAVLATSARCDMALIISALNTIYCIEECVVNGNIHNNEDNMQLLMNAINDMPADELSPIRIMTLIMIVSVWPQLLTNILAKHPNFDYLFLYSMYGIVNTIVLAAVCNVGTLRAQIAKLPQEPITYTNLLTAHNGDNYYCIIHSILVNRLICAEDKIRLLTEIISKTSECMYPVLINVFYRHYLIKGYSVQQLAVIDYFVFGRILKHNLVGEKGVLFMNRSDVSKIISNGYINTAIHIMSLYRGIEGHPFASNTSIISTIGPALVAYQCDKSSSRYAQYLSNFDSAITDSIYCSNCGQKCADHMIKISI